MILSEKSERKIIRWEKSEPEGKNVERGGEIEKEWLIEIEQEEIYLRRSITKTKIPTNNWSLFAVAPFITLFNKSNMAVICSKCME